MGGRRAGRKAAFIGGFVEPAEGQIIMRVAELRGSNLLEVEDDKRNKTLCMIPAKFNKSLWIKRGNYVLVEEGDREKALEDNCKVTGTVVEVLYSDQVRMLKKSKLWPEGFELEDIKPAVQQVQQDRSAQDVEASLPEEDSDEEDEDGLPPLEHNTNRRKNSSVSYCSSSEGEDSD